MKEEIGLMKEYMISADLYKPLDNPSLLKQMKGSLEGKRGYPLFKVSSDFLDRPILYTYAPQLQVKMLADPGAFKKFHEVAIKFGFRGYSTGEKNGIFLTRKSDKGLLRAIETYIEQNELEVLGFLEAGSADGLRGVKIVCHHPDGERMVGAYNTQKDRMHFFDTAKY